MTGKGGPEFIFRFCLTMAWLFAACALDTSGTSIIDSFIEIPDVDADIFIDVDEDTEDTTDPPIDGPELTDVIDPAVDEILPDLVCEPGSTWCTAEGEVAMCNDEGTGFVTMGCHYGCSDTPEPHCLEFIPSNVPDASLLCLAETLTFAPAPPVASIGVNTDTGSIYSWDEDWNSMGPIRGEGEGLHSGIYFTVVEQPDGAPSLAVFTVESYFLPEGMNMYAWGENALVIFSCGDVTIAGALEASADHYSGSGGTYLPGPGGSDLGAGIGAGGNGISSSSNVSGGGGGGGFGGFGGAGNGDNSSGGGAGTFYANDVLIPLFGGSGGGSGADNSSGKWGNGGAGGGALQISTQGILTVQPTGVIAANGWYGFGGQSSGGGGGGGGSGGGILLEAYSIHVLDGAVICANGGGGGSGGHHYYDDYYDGDHGEKGQWSLEAAEGGEAPTSIVCDGGDGNSALDLDGQTVVCDGLNGGGGGGGAGRIRFNAMEHHIEDGTTSPDILISPTTTTHGFLNLY